MSVGPEATALITSDLDGPLPWSLLFDSDLRIIHVGQSLKKHAPGIQEGASFSDVISVVRPPCAISSFEDLDNLSGSLIVIKAGDFSIPLRGSFYPTANNRCCLLAAVPLITSQQELTNANVTLNDFAAQDSLPDLLFVLQARDVVFREAQESSKLRDEDRQRLKSILDSALDAMITIDLDGRVVEFNDVATDIFGYDREEAIGTELAELIVPPEMRAQHRAGLAHFRKTSEGPVLRQRLEIMGMHKEGHEIPVEMVIIPFKHAEKQYFTATLRDLTEARKQQQALREAAEHERLLGRELDHRVKNMLAQILVLCFEAESKSTADHDVIESLRRRIQNFSAVHDVLSHERATGVRCEELTRLCLAPYESESGSIFDVKAPDCRLVPKASMFIAMVLNELATNAAKHGAIRHGGRVFVYWSIDDGSDPVLTLQWREQHSGPVPDMIVGGFGAQILLAGVPHELGGSAGFEHEAAGLVYTATMPLKGVLQA